MFGLISKRAHDRVIREPNEGQRTEMAQLKAMFSMEEFSGATTLPEKVALALERLEQHRQSLFLQRQRALTAGGALNEALKERDEALAELARWKPARDAKGHFVKADAAAKTA